MKNSLPLVLALFSACRSCDGTQNPNNEETLNVEDAAVLIGEQPNATTILEGNGGLAPELDTATYTQQIQEVIEASQDNPAKQ